VRNIWVYFGPNISEKSLEKSLISPKMSHHIWKYISIYGKMEI
jgi:hypothetical protein